MKRLLVVCVVLGCSRDAERAPRQVVFVCEHGAAKSVIAGEYFNKLAAERGLAVRAIARGAQPQAELSASAVRGLRADGMTPQLAAPRPIAAAELRGSARIVAFDCGTQAMRPFGGMDACWNDVPTVGDGYTIARDAIRAHVAEMVDQLASESKP